MNAFIRPHGAKAGESKSILRWVWEFCHKGIGYATSVVAIINIYLGMNELRKLHSHSYWYIVLYSVYLGCLLLMAVVLKVVGIFVIKAQQQKKGEKQ